MDGLTKIEEAARADVGSRMPRRSLRNIALLAMCQALTQSSNTLMFASAALAVLTIVPPEMRMWANLPVTMQHLGVMLSVFPASMLMMRRGRRLGFRTGSVAGMIGASCSAIGLGIGSFPVMCLGGLLLGFAIANMQLYRFAAVELAPPHFRAQAISYVTAGGIVAGFIGPTLARWTPELWMPTFQASFVAVVGLHIVVFIILTFIEFPVVKNDDHASAPQRPLLEIVTQPTYMVAASGAMIAFGVMSFVMAASPLAIVQCGLDKTEAPVTIFVHVMGMFIPAFFTGHLIARFGVFNVMIAGVALLIAGVVIALMGTTAWNFRGALSLNGVGWNFLFVGATTLLTTTYRPSERGKAQAFNDFIVFGTTTISSLMASVVLELKGWAVLNYVAFGLVCIALLVIGLFRLRNPSHA
ncbi:Predicted arabinose efflux permease, MFS family [Enhydrobacter aerosaccus]|uniref:Predicted arabinose efflux permease, MFS family n=1 Tax=Enhydrobacter aerosaccus TaxID=225324 RepID=A0A1T4LC77_9HYPH|nr:MFS transporter [Enhydrobacter aerosaccus]SJZ52402.1 Predicted arabinose efflux permease, MFS family [Enhydrobacter aerosaccus]